MINLILSPTKTMFYKIIWMLFMIPSCVFSASELHRLCSQPFTCSDQTELYYPFWNSEREACGHPEFKVECTTSVAQVSISSVKFRILSTDLTSRTTRLSRSDYIDNLCPQDALDAPFDETVLPFAPNTEFLTIYYECTQDFSSYVSTYVGSLDCTNEGWSYYVTRNLSSSLLQGTRGFLEDFSTRCSKNVSIPATGQALRTLQNNQTQDNLKKALDKGFELQLNQQCSMCIDSGGACGYSNISSDFVCYCIDDIQSHTCGSRKKRTSTGAITGIVVAIVLVMALLQVLTLFPSIRRRRKTSKSHDLIALNPQQNMQALIPLKQYSYTNVKRITNSFAQVIGKGGFGTVYGGRLSDGRSVAVKVLKDSEDKNGEDFINEVSSMSQTSHVNIVTLLGFCSEGSKRAFLYEFLENGSLDKFLGPSILDYTTLYNIALGVARGLEYLHHGCRTRIVHFDIKPQNVLLDDNLCPKVSDFGLAKLCKSKESIVSLLHARGTIGYIAPELVLREYGRVSHKSDVYSYGMLVLEMIGARTKPSTGNTASSASSMYFPEWIYKDIEKEDNGKLIENGTNTEEEVIAKKMTLVGLWCVQSWPSNRPGMNKVVEMMEGNLNAIELPPKPVMPTPPRSLQEFLIDTEDISDCGELCSINVG